MSDEVLFLQPSPAILYTPNIVSGQTLGAAIFDHTGVPLGALTNTETESLVIGGEAAAIANASAIFDGEPPFPSLLALADTSGSGIDGTYEGTGHSNAEVVATFDVSNGQPLLFSFSVVLGLLAKEIENPDVEFNQATATTSFLILDTSNGETELLDYLTIQGDLVSSQQIGEIAIDGSDGLLDAPDITQTLLSDVDGDNGFDSLYADVNGTYEKTFDSSVSQVTVVQVQTIETTFAGDTLIGNLGSDVQYGTIGDDNLVGTDNDDKMYGSLGNDSISGQSGNDIIEGGRGNDALYGNGGDDDLHGGAGDDRLKPNKGNDTMAGGAGADLFIIGQLRADEIDTIIDFEVGVDQIHIPSLGRTAKQQLFDTIQETATGAKLTFVSGGQLVIAGQTASSLGSAEALFV